MPRQGVLCVACRAMLSRKDSKDQATVISVLTEFAMKQASWASWCI